MMTGRATRGRAARRMGWRKVMAWRPSTLEDPGEPGADAPGSPDRLSPGARAADEEAREHLFIVLVRRHPMKIHCRLQHDLAQRLEVGPQRLVVAVRDVVRLGKDRWPTLHVEEAHRPPKLEAQFQRVEQMKHRHVVLAKAQVLEALTKQLR